MNIAGGPLKERIVARARELGLAAVGVQRAEPLPGVEEALSRRRALGLESPFEAGDHPGRGDPRHLLEGARSVIVAALSYYEPFPTPPEAGETETAGTEGDGVPAGVEAGPRGVVSRYAWGEDYHRTLRERLLTLADFLEGEVPGAACRVFVDTGPLVERANAARTGMGWIGKNCCLITPGHGSWVFLGAIVTSVPLEPDEPVAPDCGDCDLCLKACPTGALIAPGVLDHRRCLGYVTQMKGAIPRELREALGRRVWGCDTCQEVCPHNREVARGEGRTPGAAEEPDYDIVRPLLIALLGMGKREFNRRLGHTAAAWRGRHVLRRNAAVALGNAGAPEAVPALVDALEDPRVEVRRHAAWALGRYVSASADGHPAAAVALERALQREEDPAVKEEIEDALAGVFVPASRGTI